MIVRSRRVEMVPQTVVEIDSIICDRCDKNISGGYFEAFVNGGNAKQLCSEECVKQFFENDILNGKKSLLDNSNMVKLELCKRYYEPKESE